MSEDLVKRLRDIAGDTNEENETLHEAADEIERLRTEANKWAKAAALAVALLQQCYVTLAFAFRRLHESSRSRDGELCLDFQKVRAQIEDYFKKIGGKL